MLRYMLKLDTMHVSIRVYTHAAQRAARSGAGAAQVLVGPPKHMIAS